MSTLGTYEISTPGEVRVLRMQGIGKDLGILKHVANLCWYRVRRGHIYLPLIGFLLFMVNPLFSQNYTPASVDLLKEEWRWVHFPELEGKGIRCLTEDQLGRVWVGVDDGIMVYDRRDWTKHGAEEGLPAATTELILAARNGTMYAASTAGIYLFNGRQWEPILEIPEGETFDVYQLRELNDGSIMLGSNLGVVQVAENQVTRVFTRSGMTDDVFNIAGDIDLVYLPDEAMREDGFHVSDILEDSRDNLWFAISFANSGTLLQFKQREVGEDEIRNYTLHKSNSQISFGEDQRLVELLTGQIWVVNRSSKIGINTYDGSRWRTISLNARFGSDEYCTGIYQTLDGTIWIASLGKLYTFSDGTWNLYRSSDSRIPTNKLILAKSIDERIWICGYKAQAYQFDYSKERWSTFQNLNYQDRSYDNSLWFLDVNGRAVSKSADDSWRMYGPGQGLMDAPVRLLITRDGEVWAAGSHKGVAATAYLRNERWVMETHPTLSWGIDYRAVLEAFDGSLWFGGAVDFDQEKGQTGGVLQLVPGENGSREWVYHRYRENGLNQSNAYGIGQSRDSLIWIGGGTLMYYDGESWNGTENPLFQDFVNIVRSSPDGLLLVGSRYYGVFTYDGNEWTSYNTESGLSSNTIMSVYSQGSNSIWVATQNSISRFDGHQWVNSVMPTEMNIHFEAGSIQGDSDGSIWINKSLREWNRRAFVGDAITTDFAKSFVAYKYKPDNHPPETFIDVFSEKVSPKGNTLVTWGGIDYMSTTPTERLSYSYRVNDGEWSDFSPELHETFVNLSAGKYVLEVRARDLDLNVDPTPVTVTFQVQPPVWRQAWFILLLLAFATVIGLFEFRVITKNNKLEKLNASLSTINTELQDKNKQIAHQNDEILIQQEQILEQKSQLERSFKDLRSQNKEIEFQRDKLAEMVVKIESLNKYKIKFFTNVSHELRTPLTLILGPAHQLNKNVNIAPELRAKLYKIIERNAFKLLKLINQMLEMRKIENNQLELYLSQGNLSQYIQEITLLFENLATQRNIELEYISECDRCQAVFDKDKIEKIVTNLMSNAFKHTPSGGRILVRLKRKMLGGVAAEQEKTQYYRLYVEDTGTGISEERLPHIFERYYSDNSDRLSSGIGLSYIKDLAELHHGQITVRSTKGVGTTFVVDIPAGLEMSVHERGIASDTTDFIMSTAEVEHLFTLIEPETEEITVGPENPAKKNILLVENDEDLLDFLGVLLEDEYNVMMATNGKAGLEVARNNTVDLIVSDIMMPVMDGLQLCHELKSDLLTSHVPVILLTAKALDGHRMEGYMQGADAYLTKPFNPQVLKSRIENLLAQRTQLREAFNREFILTPKHVELDSLDESLLQQVVNMMEKHVDDAEFNVNKMCHIVGMSHTHFIRKIKQLTGKKPVDLLKSFRLNRAKDLLKQNNANISEIAYMVGYNLPNSFSRAFRKEFGVSPKEFAESHLVVEADNGSPSSDHLPSPESLN